MGSLEVADPYVERLLEGFAFLTARVQLKLEAEFPTFTQSLLQMVYPHYMAPTPSMAVVRFTPDTGLRTMPQGVTIPAGTTLRSPAGNRGPDQLRVPHRPRRAVAADRAGGGGVCRLASRGVRAGAARPGAGGGEGGDPAAAARDGRGGVRQDPAGKADLLHGWAGRRAHPPVRTAGGKRHRDLPCAPPPALPRSRDLLPPSAIRPVGFEADEALLPPRTAILRRLPAAAGILRDAGAHAVRGAVGAGPGGDPHARAASWTS